MQNVLPLRSCHLLQIKELTVTLTRCSTRESGSHTLPEQHSRADPIDRGVNEPSKKVSVSDQALSLIYHMVVWVRKRSPHPHSPHCLWQVREPSPEITRARELAFTSHQLKHWAEWPLNLAQAAQLVVQVVQVVQVLSNQPRT